MTHTLAPSSPRLQAGAISGAPLREALGNLDLSRIAAESGAIAVHVAALLLLLAPMSAPPEPATPEPDIVIVDRLIPKTPPVPPRPEVVKVVPSTPRTVTPIARPVQADPPPVEVPDPAPTDLQAAQLVADVGPTRSDTISEPLAGVQLEYSSAPPPRYPVDAMRAGQEGTVILRVLVGIDGKPLDVSIERSSGHRSLDLAAKRQVLAKWRFKAAMRNGQVVQAIGLVPVDFSLD